MFPPDGISENICIWPATQIRIFTHVGDTWCVPGVYNYFLCILVVSVPLKLSNHLKDNANPLALSWRSSLLYRNQSIDLLCKSMDWFLYDRDLGDERVKDQCLIHNWPIDLLVKSIVYIGYFYRIETLVNKVLKQGTNQLCKKALVKMFICHEKDIKKYIHDI